MRAVLRLLALALVFTVPLLQAGPALAQEDEEEEESVYPDDWPRTNKLAAGFNNFITFSNFFKLFWLFYLINTL